MFSWCEQDQKGTGGADIHTITIWRRAIPGQGCSRKSLKSSHEELKSHPKNDIEGIRSRIPTKLQVYALSLEKSVLAKLLY